MRWICDWGRRGGRTCDAWRMSTTYEPNVRTSPSLPSIDESLPCSSSVSIASKLLYSMGAAYAVLSPRLTESIRKVPATVRLPYRRFRLALRDLRQRPSRGSEAGTGPCWRLMWILLWRRALTRVSTSLRRVACSELYWFRCASINQRRMRLGCRTDATVTMEWFVRRPRGGTGHWQARLPASVQLAK